MPWILFLFPCQVEWIWLTVLWKFHWMNRRMFLQTVLKTVKLSGFFQYYIFAVMNNCFHKMFEIIFWQIRCYFVSCHQRALFPIFCSFCAHLSWTATIYLVQTWTAPPWRCGLADHLGSWSHMDNISSSSEKKTNKHKEIGKKMIFMLRYIIFIYDLTYKIMPLGLSSICPSLTNRPNTNFHCPYSAISG